MVVKRIFFILNKEFSSINQAAFLLGFFALLSQILGLVRDKLLAYYIGPSPTLDAYYAAFRVPDFIYISIASLASITVLIPFLVKKMSDGRQNEEVKKFMDGIFTAFLTVMIAVSLVVFFLLPLITRLVTPGFSPALQREVVNLSRIMLISPILLGLSNLFGTITQFFKKFFVFALSPIFYNFGIIIGIVFLYPLFGGRGLAFGVILGALMHLLIQLPTVIKNGFSPRISTLVDWKQLKEVISLSLPRTLGLVSNNLALIILVSIASFMYQGSISIFNFSLNLQSVPLGIIGMSYSVAAFPTLAKFFGLNDQKNFVGHLSAAAKQIIFWSMPITFLFIVLRAQIVRVIYGSGAFNWGNTRLTAAALAFFSISILAQGLILLFTRGYYAAHQTKKPLIINFLCSVLIVVLAYVLFQVFVSFAPFRNLIESILRVSDIQGTEVLMLPLAYSIGTIFNLILHWVHFKKDFVGPGQFLRKVFLQSLVSSFVIGVVAYLALGVFDDIFRLNTFLGIFLQGLFAGLLGLVAGFIVLKIMKNDELNQITETIRTKFWKAKVIAPSQGDLV